MDTGKKITEEFQKYFVQIKPTEENVEPQQARSEKEPEQLRRQEKNQATEETEPDRRASASTIDIKEP